MSRPGNGSNDDCWLATSGWRRRQDDRRIVKLRRGALCHMSAIQDPAILPSSAANSRASARPLRIPNCGPARCDWESARRSAGLRRVSHFGSSDTRRASPGAKSFPSPSRSHLFISAMLRSTSNPTVIREEAKQPSGRTHRSTPMPLWLYAAFGLRHSRRPSVRRSRS